jgi:hypothetical protein
VITEIMYHPADRADGRNLEFIEIHNSGLIAEDLGGHRFSDEFDFIVPDQTIVPAGGFLLIAPSPEDVRAVTGLTNVIGGFSRRLSNGGGRIRLHNPAGAILLEIEYSDSAPWPVAADGAGPSLVLARPSYGEADPRAWSPGAHEPAPAEPPILALSDPRLQPVPENSGDVVINEIMFHPLSDNDAEEYIELHNRGASDVDLSGWRLEDGVEYVFPIGTRIPAGGYIVVAADVVRLRALHPGLTAANSFGNFRGRLSNSGERVALARPDPDAGGALVVVNEVFYRDGGQWGEWSDGGGSSLELIDPRANNALAANWADSDESAKAPWTVLEATGVLDHGAGAADRVQLLAQGAGEYLVDDVEVLTASGASAIANGHFNSGLSGWTAQGTMGGSEWFRETADADAGNGALRVVAVGRGDTGVNQIRASLNRILSPGTTATLRARVRWLRGHPEFLIRLRGNYLEAAGALTVPSNLGTPAAPNSRRMDNAPPAIGLTVHDPVLPASGEPVRVMVRVDDSDGLGQVSLRYRVDPSPTPVIVPMRDDGQYPDEIASDGVYSAEIPGRPSGTLIAYRVVARDLADPPAESTSPTHEALIRFGEPQPSGRLGVYCLWMTQETFNRWSSRSKLDNSPLPVTFVYNRDRVVHNVGALFAGSPHIAPGYSTPSGNLCGYSLTFPKDEPFLGATDVVLDWPGRDATAQQEPMANWIAQQLGIPCNHRRYVRLRVNGVTETTRGSIYEDAQQVNGDLVESWNPDLDRGDLFKIEQWFEFNDGVTHIGPPRLEPYLTEGGVKKTARYRWSWLKRALANSANDYDSLFELVDAAHTPSSDAYVNAVSALVDVEQWMRVFATENIVVNFDAWGCDIGKNMYAYKPRLGRWQLFMWDIDWVMLASAQHGYTPQSPLMYRGPAVFGGENRDPAVGRMYSEPAFQRAYWRAIRDAINGPLVPERVAARMDATYSALREEGVTRSAGAALASPGPVKDWLRQRRDYLSAQLAAVQSPFSVSAPPSVVTNANSVSISGKAPIEVSEFRVNGVPVAVRWTAAASWTLTLPLTPGMNAFELEGFDNRGRPLANAKAGFTVRLQVAPPEILSFVADDTGFLTLTWKAEPGAVYQAQRTDRLDSGVWTTIGPQVAASGDTASLTQPGPRADANQFFRIVRLR